MCREEPRGGVEGAKDLVGDPVVADKLSVFTAAAPHVGPTVSQKCGWASRGACRRPVLDRHSSDEAWLVIERVERGTTPDFTEGIS